MYFLCALNFSMRTRRTMGSILHPAQMTLYTNACLIPILHARKAGFFPQKTHVGKLGNELALPGRIGAKGRRVSAQTFPSAILHFQKTIAPLTRKKLV